MVRPTLVSLVLLVTWPQSKNLFPYGISAYSISLNKIKLSIPICLMYRYGQFGDVSLKIDVYAFGVVLYELISAKQAIIRASEIATESKGLVGLVALNHFSTHQFNSHLPLNHQKSLKLNC